MGGDPHPLDSSGPPFDAHRALVRVALLKSASKSYRVCCSPDQGTPPAKVIGKVHMALRFARIGPQQAGNRRAVSAAATTSNMHAPWLYSRAACRLRVKRYH